MPARGASAAPIQRSDSMVRAKDAESLRKEARNEQGTLRQIGSKTFFHKDNRWVDSSVKPDEDAKATRIAQFSEAFFQLARTQSAELNQYLTFTEPVTLKLAGQVYRIDPAEREH